LREYDYLIVGSGLFGAVFAHEMTAAGKSCLVLEKRAHIGGNLYCDMVDDIIVHRYGAHIFHTSNARVWDYVNRLTPCNHFINAPVANYKGKLYNLPFNMNTFYQLWGTVTPQQAQEKIRQQRSEIHGEPKNLEEQAIHLVGRDVYEKLIREYTEKQWGKPCTELPAFIIQRLPVRFRYDNNYFNDPFQGIPEGGYNPLIEKLLAGCDLLRSTNYLQNRARFRSMAKKVVYTGTIDTYFDYCFGALEYRSLRFETQTLAQENYQGVAVVNYTDRETLFTRIIEHKHFVFGTQPATVITREYSAAWEPGMEPYYPVNNPKNTARYEQYRAKAASEENIIFGGRLAEYKYYDMDKVIASALDAAEKELLTNP